MKVTLFYFPIGNINFFSLWINEDRGRLPVIHETDSEVVDGRGQFPVRYRKRKASSGSAAINEQLRSVYIRVISCQSFQNVIPSDFDPRYSVTALKDIFFPEQDFHSKNPRETVFSGLV